MLTVVLGGDGDPKGAVKISSHCLENNKLDICVIL